jgi:iron(III) transport system ATP-binding protein
MKSPALLRVENVDKRYGPHFPPAISHLTLGLEEGEILALLGPSGSGKTTALRLIAGFEIPDKGAIVLNGVPVAGDGCWLPPEAR